MTDGRLNSRYKIGSEDGDQNPAFFPVDLPLFR
jgi:hypothetical protein